jgi:hypothetical protein
MKYFFRKDNEIIRSAKNCEFFSQAKNPVLLVPSKSFPKSRTELTGMNLRGTTCLHRLARLLLMESAVTNTS